MVKRNDNDSRRLDRLDRILAGASPMELGDPAPETTIEAIMFSVRERGLSALKEPATMERLSRCDAAAHSQINERIAKLQDAGRLPQEVANA